MATERFNPNGLVLSENYAQTMNEAVLPFLEARREVLSVRGDEDRPLYAERCRADAPRGTALLVHGFTENAFKFSELIHSLLKNGWNVVAYDQRGHGRSWRDPALEEPSLTHVDDFESYVRDLEQVCAQALGPMPRPWVAFAHSMGGAVTSLFLERHPGVFSRAALCAPMIAPNLGGLPAPAAELMCAGAKALGREKKRVFVSKPYSGPEDFATSCAAGRARFDWYDAVKAGTPAFRNNGPTYGWLREAMRATKLLLQPGAPEAIDAAVRLYAAESDDSVMPEPQIAFINRVKGGVRRQIAGSKHEIYRSGDDVLFPWWDEILNFFKEERP